MSKTKKKPTAKDEREERWNIRPATDANSPLRRNPRNEVVRDALRSADRAGVRYEPLLAAENAVAFGVTTPEPEPGRRDGDVTGWSIMGDGSEVWTFTEEADDRNYATALAFLEDATTCREDFGGRCHLHAGHAGPHRRADGLQWEDETFTLTEEQIRASIERNKPLLDRLARGGDCRACVAAGPEGCEEHREGTR